MANNRPNVWLSGVAIALTATALTAILILLVDVREDGRSLRSDRDYIDTLREAVPLMQLAAQQMSASVATLKEELPRLSESMTSLGDRLERLEKTIETEESRTIIVKLARPDKQNYNKLVYIVPLKRNVLNTFDEVLGVKWWDPLYSFARELQVVANWPVAGSSMTRIEVRATPGNEELLGEVIKIEPTVVLVLSKSSQ